MISLCRGIFAALVVGTPVLLMLCARLLLQHLLIEYTAMRGLPPEATENLDTGRRQLLLAEIQSVASDRISGESSELTLAAAERLNSLRDTVAKAIVPTAIILAAAPAAVARRRARAEFRAGSTRSVLFCCC